MKIFSNKIFWFLLTFGLSCLFLMLGFPTIGAIFMVYPVVLTLVGIAYGAIINPIREYKDRKRYLSYRGNVSGSVTCDGNLLDTVKIVIKNADIEFDIDASNYYAFTDFNGSYNIPHVKNGNLIITAYKRGYLNYEKSFKLLNSESINIDIILIKE